MAFLAWLYTIGAENLRLSCEHCGLMLGLVTVLDWRNSAVTSETIRKNEWKDFAWNG